ncbi:MAG: GNAT family N-acetyltransferase [Ferruginibacter sp.]
MFADIAYPQKLLPEELDKYLAGGWFRMRQSIFTTNFLHFSQRFYSAIWLRVVLDHSIHDKKYHTLHKLNKNFTTGIKKARAPEIAAAHETLYQIYRESISFDVSPTLQELLIGNQTYNRFNTYVVNVYDDDKLIAAGFFDLGKESAAGITCIYHPAYKKYSLGKYLMYLKMDFCKQRRLKYFYPGYFVPGYKPFDYKIEIGKASLQYLQLSTQQWVPYPAKAHAQNPLDKMLVQLASLQPYLEKALIPHAILFYKFFEVNLDPYYNGNGLFDFPVFIYCIPEDNTSFYRMIVYDIRDSKYHLLQCGSVINTGFQQEVNTLFDSDLLNIEQDLFESASPEEISDELNAFYKRS